MSAYELAQLNIAIMREPLESPGMADFVANLARINALAEDSVGFVWRLQTEEGDATAMRPMADTSAKEGTAGSPLNSAMTCLWRRRSISRPFLPTAM